MIFRTYHISRQQVIPVVFSMFCALHEAEVHERLNFPQILDVVPPIVTSKKDKTKRRSRRRNEKKWQRLNENGLEDKRAESSLWMRSHELIVIDETLARFSPSITMSFILQNIAVNEKMAPKPCSCLKGIPSLVISCASCLSMKKQALMSWHIYIYLMEREMTRK